MHLPTPEQIALAQESLRLHKRRDPVGLHKANKFQQRLYRSVLNPKPDTLTVVLALKPNRVGGSFGTMTIWSAIMFGTEHPRLQGFPFGDAWPFLKSARLFSTAENLADVGALQIAMKRVFPVNKYEQNRGVGKSYNSAGETRTGWNWDAFSYGQDALAAAGANKGLILMSEPPPRPLFTEAITRLSGSGLMIVECTQLDLAPWLEEMAEDAGGQTIDGVTYGALRLDGKDVGEVRVVRGTVEDACREHSDGHMAHTAIEAMVAAWPAEEREARADGKKMSLSGRILPNWGQDNELAEIPDYHADCIARGEFRLASVCDPHDRKPWFCTWFAGFPNEDVIALCEWPPFVFHECKASPVSDIERYRDVILETEAALSAQVGGRKIDVRLMDGKFGAAIKSGRGLNCVQMLAAPCVDCASQDGIKGHGGPWGDEEEPPQQVSCPHRLYYKLAPVYDGSVRDGNMLMRAQIGEGGARPKFYAMKETTPNLCISMRRYAWKENTREDRGLSEKPQLVFKDGADTARMLFLAKFHIWPDEPSETRIIPRRKY